MRAVTEWLDEYGDSHRNSTNKRLHWICVPVIVWCVMGLVWSLPVPGVFAQLAPGVNWADITVIAALLYYGMLSLALALGALPIFLLMLWSLDSLGRAAWAPVWLVCIAMFVLAWIGQFIGHAIEGKRPSFLKDVQFLLIGPLWLLADLYRRLGIRY
jgi:uncharacterized membrane protein YGL010W